LGEVAREAPAQAELRPTCAGPTRVNPGYAFLAPRRRSRIEVPERSIIHDDVYFLNVDSFHQFREKLAANLRE
jgi:hypothetical protein